MSSRESVVGPDGGAFDCGRGELTDCRGGGVGRDCETLLL